MNSLTRVRRGLEVRSLQVRTLALSLVVVIAGSASQTGASTRKVSVEAFGRLCRIGRQDYVDLRYSGFLARPSVKPFTPNPVPPEVEMEPEQNPRSGSRIKVTGVNWSKVLLSAVRYKGITRSSEEPILVRGTMSGGILRVRSLAVQESLRSARSDGLDISVDGRFRSSVTFSRNWASPCSIDMGAYEPAGPSVDFSAVVALDPTARVRRLVAGQFELVTVLNVDDEVVVGWKHHTGGRYCNAETPREFSFAEFDNIGLPSSVRVNEWLDGGTRYAVVYGPSLDQSTIKEIHDRFGAAAIFDLQLRTAPS
jgi:hypothetical protein